MLCLFRSLEYILKFFLIFQFQGEDHFTWIDKAGSKHSFRELNSSQICDEKAPVLLEEMARVTNKDWLPLLGYTYGSVDYEGQELTVKFDSLICLPDMEFEEKNSIPNKLLRLENGINSTNEDLVNQGEELQSVKLNLQNQIDSKASQMDLQNLTVRGSFSIFIEFKLMVNPIFCRLMSVARLLSQSLIQWKQA